MENLLSGIAYREDALLKIIDRYGRAGVSYGYEFYLYYSHCLIYLRRTTFLPSSRFHDVIHLSGTLEEILAAKADHNAYLFASLKDTSLLEDPMSQLRSVYPYAAWVDYLSHGGKSFFAYSGDGVHYYAFKNKTWSAIKPRELNASVLKDGKKVVYPAKSLSYEAFLARAPEGPYPGLEEDPDLIVGDLDLNDQGLLRVVRFVNGIHSRQKDRGGHPYIYHPIWVAEHVSDAAKKVALLHDSMEDCGVNEEKLRSLGLSEKEVLAVKALTRQGSENTLEGYFAYVQGIRETNPFAYEVKQADLLMNMDLRRLPTLGVLDLERAFKYEAALM